MNIEMLAVEDFSGMDEASVKAKIAEDFNIPLDSLCDINIVVAYMSVGSWGCDSSAFIVFERNGVLYEVNASHCSCHGFGSSNYGDNGDTQWQPEAIELIDAIIKRDDWAIAGGGYDSDRQGNASAIKNHLLRLSDK